MKNIVIIGGGGHVGIPLGLALASKKYDVTLLDVNPQTVHDINKGVLPFVEEGATLLLQKHIGKNLFASLEPDCVRKADVVFFVTGTPVDEHLNPRIQDVLNVVEQYMPLLNDNQLVILRSTLYPGTMRIIANLFRQRNKNAKLAFCPERILQGKGIVEIFSLPQLVSALTPQAEEEAAELFSSVASKIIRVTPEEAELAKLMTNAWRYLEFAIANQFYMIAEQHGQDFYKIFHAMVEDYPRAAHFARPGLAAGPCLFKDTMQLASFHDNGFFLGHAAMLVNEGFPNMLVQMLKSKMNNSLVGKKIAILGMTFKANNDDIRESLSYKIKKLLLQQMAEVLPSDPYLADSVPLEKALAEADGIIIGAAHNEYRNLKVRQPYVDCWNIISKSEKK